MIAHPRVRLLVLVIVKDIPHYIIALFDIKNWAHLYIKVISIVRIHL